MNCHHAIQLLRQKYYEVHYFAYCLFRVSDYLYVNKYNKILSREKDSYCLQGILKREYIVIYKYILFDILNEKKKHYIKTVGMRNNITLL